jgi:hypothetical protein
MLDWIRPVAVRNEAACILDSVAFAEASSLDEHLEALNLDWPLASNPSSVVAEKLVDASTFEEYLKCK